MPDREKLVGARRVVVKIGSRTLASDPDIYARLASSIAALRGQGRGVVLVSSGAIALGTGRLGLRVRPREMARLQAAAATGQSALMRAYEEAFGARGVTVAQVLLTHADLADRARSNNARAALGALLEARVLPVLNENDSVSVEEIRFGDNDQLAALVAPLVDANLVILLSDVEGLLDADGVRVKVVRDVATEALAHVRKTTKGGLGSGGMASKIEAARKANLAGADVVVADARVPGVIDAVVRGEDVGTWFVAPAKKFSARRHWIAFALRPKGAIVLDPGASEAVRAKGRSVLGVGVVGVRGDFQAGDAVSIVSISGEEIGRGLSRASVENAVRLAGRASDGDDADVLVHRDDLAIW
jgi:glutamate 5-kinase